MERQLSARLTGLAPIILPIIAIALARAMTHTDWAAANVGLAALLFGWIVADSLLLATIAKAENKRPGLRALLGAAALASLVIMVGAAAPVRAQILAMPPVVAAFALTLGLFLAWSGVIIFQAIASGANKTEAAKLVMPARLVDFMALESQIMRFALLGWWRDQDVPQGAQAFDYHRFLLPMIYAFLVLQVIELVVMHFLLMQWNMTVAWIWFALGVAGVLWIIGLAQGFRIHPLLLTDEGLRVRSGLMVDVLVPFDGIAGFVTSLSAERVNSSGTLNQAVLSWPNVMIDLERPIRVEPMIGAARSVETIALRVDDSAAFTATLGQRIGRRDNF